MTAQSGLTLYLVLRAFSGGCSAMTGTEAISNGVPAFKPPESRNAAISLGIMAAILGTFLLGVTHLAQVLQLVPTADGSETILSMVARAVFGSGTFLYFALQIATMAILFMGANTSFADFPRLSSILARDGLMPRQFMNLGDRLAFSNGIIGLGLLAIIVLSVFKAQVNSMIPLYAVGVFCSFTLSQAGMVVHWFKVRGRNWRKKAAMNGFGALLTGVVLMVVLVTKFVQGAYLVLIATLLLIMVFTYLRRHYLKIAQALQPRSQEALMRLIDPSGNQPKTTLVLFVDRVDQLTAAGVALATSLKADRFKAVAIAHDESSLQHLVKDWQGLGAQVPLVELPATPGRFVDTATRYIDSLAPTRDNGVLVIIPRRVVKNHWQGMLRNQTPNRLKAAMRRLPWVMTMEAGVALR